MGPASRRPGLHDTSVSEKPAPSVPGGTAPDRYRGSGLAALRHRFGGICGYGRPCRFKQEDDLSSRIRGVFAALMGVALCGLSVSAAVAETAPRKVKVLII